MFKLSSIFLLALLTFACKVFNGAYYSLLNLGRAVYEENPQYYLFAEDTNTTLPTELSLDKLNWPTYRIFSTNKGTKFNCFLATKFSFSFWMQITKALDFTLEENIFVVLYHQFVEDEGIGISWESVKNATNDIQYHLKFDSVSVPSDDSPLAIIDAVITYILSFTLFYSVKL